MVTQATLKYMGVKADDDPTKLIDEANQRLEDFIDALNKAGADLTQNFSWISVNQAQTQAGKKEITSDFSDIMSAFSQVKTLAGKLQNTLSP